MIYHLADLESDFSRFHRVDDIYQLDGPRFFRMARRLSAYEGVMRMRVEAQQQPHSVAPSSPASGRAATGGAKVLDLASFMVNHPGLIDRRKAG